MLHLVCLSVNTVHQPKAVTLQQLHLLQTHLQKYRDYITNFHLNWRRAVHLTYSVSFILLSYQTIATLVDNERQRWRVTTYLRVPQDAWDRILGYFWPSVPDLITVCAGNSLLPMRSSPRYMGYRGGNGVCRRKFPLFVFCVAQNVGLSSLYLYISFGSWICAEHWHVVCEKRTLVHPVFGQGTWSESMTEKSRQEKDFFSPLATSSGIWHPLWELWKRFGLLVTRKLL